MTGPQARGLALLIALALSVPAPALSADASIGGFGEVRFSALPGVEDRWWNLTERFRPRFEGNFHPRISATAEVELLLRQGRNPTREFQYLLEGSDFGPLLEAADVAWPTRANEELWVDDITDVLTVERLYVDVYLPVVDVRIGRQALFWGSAMMINPTDPFPEFLLAEPWRQRAGTNAIRSTFALDERADLALVVATNDTFNKIRGAGRFRLTMDWADLALVAAYRQDDHDGLIGLDLRGELGVGWWFEGALHIDDAITEEFAVGIDYSFPVLDGLIVMAQYYRNGYGAGPKDEPVPLTSRLATELPDELVDLFAAQAPTDGEAEEPEVFTPLLGGRDYLLITINQIFAPEVSASVVALQNLSDGTGFLLPAVTVSPTDWLQLALNAQIPYRLWGDGGEFKPNPDDLLISQDIPLLATYEADLSGLVPDTTITVWTRASF
jgi:hypothetical protein